MGKILLFYQYITLENPGKIRAWQLKLCQSLSLTGRIIIATEGINGTVGGSQESVNAYIQAMQENPLFADIDFKCNDGGSEYFPRLRIVIKDEIVHLGLDTQKITALNGGKHLTPTQAHELLTQKPENLVLLDGRNYYEARIGTFEGAITPAIQNFREFPEYIDNNTEHFKDKQVLMFCTGGIRCERASAYLKSKGVTQEVFQISGGIERYVQQYPNGFFRGKNYVFDGRVSVRINQDILSLCDICTISCDEYTNCLNAECNKQYIACLPCLQTLGNTCSKNCHYLVTNKLVIVRTIAKKIPIPGSSCSINPL